MLLQEYEMTMTKNDYPTWFKTLDKQDLLKPSSINPLYGTKIFNRKTGEIGLLIKTWENEFADGSLWFATCVDKKGEKYHIELDDIVPLEDTDDSKK
mgnify:CR=1 FL=1